MLPRVHESQQNTPVLTLLKSIGRSNLKDKENRSIIHNSGSHTAKNCTRVLQTQKMAAHTVF